MTHFIINARHECYMETHLDRKWIQHSGPNNGNILHHYRNWWQKLINFYHSSLFSRSLAIFTVLWFSCSIVSSKISYVLFGNSSKKSAIKWRKPTKRFPITITEFFSSRPQDTAFEATYFWFSLFSLLGRTLLIALYAARVHDESQKPANIIRAIPNDAYETEVCIPTISLCESLARHKLKICFFYFLLMQANRFLEVVVNKKVGITGMRFFYFTRPLILSVVGTILTYELVLVQFQVLTPKTKENMCKGFQWIRVLSLGWVSHHIIHEVFMVVGCLQMKKK